MERIFKWLIIIFVLLLAAIFVASVIGQRASNLHIRKIETRLTEGYKLIELSLLVEEEWDKICIIPVDGRLLYNIQSSKMERAIKTHFGELLGDPDFTYKNSTESTAINLVVMKDHRIISNKRIGYYGQEKLWQEPFISQSVHGCSSNQDARLVLNHEGYFSLKGFDEWYLIDWEKGIVGNLAK